MTETVVDPFAFTLGPRDAKILLVGEAWGSEERAAQRPFIGPSGNLLNSMLADAGLVRGSILTTNVVDAQPSGNDFTNFLYPIKEKKELYRGIHPTPQLLAGLTKLERLVDTVKPTLIIAAGNWPLFALSSLDETSTTRGYKLPGGITKWRGSQLFSRPIGGRSYPLLPIVHPASTLREMAWRQPTVHDIKARGVRFVNGETKWEAPERPYVAKPTFKQVWDFFARLQSSLTRGPVRLSVDLETYRRRWISVIGVADELSSFAIPLFYVDRSKGDERTINYWTASEETWLFETLKTILEHPNVRIVGQNFIYDTQWLHRLYNIRATVSFDTMVAHHLAYPGTPKALDYLASLYCDHYVYWKDESGDWDNFPADAERYWLYNAKDITATLEISSVLEGVLKTYQLEDLYKDRMDQWEMAREMMIRGIRFDKTAQQAMKLELLEQSNNLQQWLLSVLPESWQYTSTGKPWYDSPKGTAMVLYQLLGLPEQKHKKTKQLTADAEALAALQKLPESMWLSPLLSRLSHLRSLGVFISHFLEARTSPDGRMKCTFNVAHPDTFRWSSNSNGFGEGTNLQNIPK